MRADNTVKIPCSRLGCNEPALFEYDDGELACRKCTEKDLELGRLNSVQAMIAMTVMASEEVMH
jgi:hypothetical protein